MTYKFINIVALSDTDLARQIAELTTEGWEVNPGNPRREGRLLFTHLQKLEGACAIDNGGAALQTLPEALRSLYQALQAPAVAGFPNQLEGVSDSILSLRESAAQLAVKEGGSQVVRESRATLDPLARVLVERFDAFRLNFGKVITTHGQILENVEKAEASSHILMDAMRDVQTAVGQVKQITEAQ